MIEQVCSRQPVVHVFYAANQITCTYSKNGRRQLWANKCALDNLIWLDKCISTIMQKNQTACFQRAAKILHNGQKWSAMVKLILDKHILYSMPDFTCFQRVVSR